MTELRKHIHLGLWLQYLDHSRWDAPDSRVEEVYRLQPYVEIAQAAEAAKLDAVIRGDGPFYHRERGHAGGTGALEIITLIAAIAARTERVGLIATASTTFQEPFNLARQLATVDHLSNGRLGWNIVTSSAGERNFGYEAIPDQAARYDRADEFLDVVEKLWNSWQPGALDYDRGRDRLVDEDRVREIHHHGPHFDVEGPLNVARSPQGRPVFIQAGSSERGKRFAAQHAEVIFTAQQEIPKAVEFYRELKERAAAAGRDPEHLRILPGLGLHLAETEAEAVAEYEQQLDQIDYEAARRRLAESWGDVDLSDLELDAQIPADRLPDTSKLARRQSRPQIFVDLAVERGYSLRKVLQSFAAGYGHGSIVGTPEQAADRIQAWVEAGAADGFVLFPSRGFQSVRLLTEQVVPILRERGLFRSEYEGTTLRSHFGLPELEAAPLPAAAAEPGEQAAVSDAE